MNAILTPQGQVTLPQTIRDALDLLPGNSVEFELDEQGRVVLRKVEDKTGASYPKPDRFDRVRGRATVPWRTDELMRMLRGDE